MRRVIAEAEVGDAVLGDDPSVNELEAFAAETLGKERALFFPSGIMANQSAILAQAAAGTEVLLDADAHILHWEDCAAAAWGGVQLRPIPSTDGLMSPEGLREALRPDSPFAPRMSLLCLENTHNSAGGRVMRPALMARLAEVARERGMRVHLDGARLANAAVALDLSLAELAAPADTVMVSLSKGLGAPVGSILAGDEQVMHTAWRLRRRLGGGMRQAGLLAAAGLFALRNNLRRLREDHERAGRLAAGARAISGLECGEPETNIVMIGLRDDRLQAPELLDALAEREVRMTQYGPRRLRAITHLDVSDQGIHRAVDALRACVQQLT